MARKVNVIKKSHFQAVIGEDCLIVCHYVGNVLQHKLAIPTTKREHTLKLLQLVSKYPDSEVSIYVDTDNQQYNIHPIPDVNMFYLGSLGQSKVSAYFQQRFFED